MSSTKKTIDKKVTFLLSWAEGRCPRELIRAATIDELMSALQKYCTTKEKCCMFGDVVPVFLYGSSDEIGCISMVRSAGMPEIFFRNVDCHVKIPDRLFNFLGLGNDVPELKDLAEEDDFVTWDVFLEYKEG